jgi:hypothetical protein
LLKKAGLLPAFLFWRRQFTRPAKMAKIAYPFTKPDPVYAGRPASAVPEAFRKGF